MEESARILIYGRAAFRFCDWLQEHGGPRHMVAATSPEEAEAYIADTEILLSWRFPPELYPRARRLRWVQSLGAGVEDIVAAAPPHVLVTRVVDQFGGPIAEYVFAELLAYVRDLPRLRAMQARREWDHFISRTLAGRTIGVAGLGSIGAEVVRKARAFDMRVYGLSRTGGHAALVDRHFLPDAWVPFVRELDALVLTLPLTPQTAGVVNAAVLAAMKPDAALVNVGRGALVVEDDLIAALRAGTLGQAILDVFTVEPLPPDSPLWTLPNVVVTPHISGPSTVDGVGSFFLENLLRYRSGQPLLGLVDRGAGY